jgi:hypothetical protein
MSLLIFFFVVNSIFFLNSQQIINLNDLKYYFFFLTKQKFCFKYFILKPNFLYIYYIILFQFFIIDILILTHLKDVKLRYFPLLLYSIFKDHHSIIFPKNIYLLLKFNNLDYFLFLICLSY